MKLFRFGILPAILLAALLAGCSEKASDSPKPKADIVAPVVEIHEIALKSKPEIEAILGHPSSCTETKYGEKCIYRDGDIEIVFIWDKADWITVNSMQGAPFDPESIRFIGLGATPHSFMNEHVIRWNDIDGLLSVELHPAGKFVFYAYVKAQTK